MTTLRPTAAIALPVAALLVMATPLAWGFAAAAAPSAAAPAPPAEQKKIPPVSGPEQAAQAPQAPKAIPVPEIVKRADEVAKRLRNRRAYCAQARDRRDPGPTARGEWPAGAGARVHHRDSQRGAAWHHRGAAPAVVAVETPGAHRVRRGPHQTGHSARGGAGPVGPPPRQLDADPFRPAGLARSCRGRRAGGCRRGRYRGDARTPSGAARRHAGFTGQGGRRGGAVRGCFGPDRPASAGSLDADIRTHHAADLESRVERVPSGGVSRPHR